MAGPTKAELAGDLAKRLGDLEISTEVSRSTGDSTSRQHASEITELRRLNELSQLRIADLATRVAALDERCRSLEKQADRSWGLKQSLILALVSLLGGAVMTFNVQSSLKR